MKKGEIWIQVDSGMCSVVLREEKHVKTILIISWQMIRRALLMLIQFQ